MECTGSNMAGFPSRYKNVPKHVVKLSAEMRHAMTPAEEILWLSLSDKKLDGLRFRNQHPEGRYIIDFCCPKIRLAVEVDGDVHKKKILLDRDRTRRLEALGYTMIRFSNNEINGNLQGVLERIRKTAEQLKNKQ